MRARRKLRTIAIIRSSKDVHDIADKIQVALFDLGGVLVELRGVPTMLAWLDHRVSLEELWKLWLSSPTVRGPAEARQALIEAGVLTLERT